MIKCLLAVVALSFAASAQSGVVRIEVISSGPFAEGKIFDAVGAYTRLTGRFYGELDPNLPANKGIVDLAKAPRNARGKVEYSAEFDILRPADAAKGNGTLLYDVNNRGRKVALREFNEAPASNTIDKPEHAGDGFLMRQGFTVVWSGWIPGLPKGGGLMHLDVPAAKGVQQAVWDEFLFNEHGQTSARLTFAAASTDQSKARLTVRDRNEDTPSTIQQSAWEFVDGNTIRLLPAGTPFRPGAIYQLTYIANDPPVAGIGFAATRDLIAFLRYDTSEQNPLAGMAKVAIGFGESQSGRYLRDMLYRGFNESESGRVVFDGLQPHIASARIFLNYRFAQPNRLYSSGFGFLGYPDASFPFSYARTKDPASGREDSLLARCSARKNCPKIIQSVTSTEYWQGGHSLNTTDPLGERDLTLPQNVRVYHVAGTQHVPFQIMPKGVCTGAPNLAVDGRPALRALLLALDRWVKTGATPPPSRYPRISDHTLVAMDEFKLPQVAGFTAPRGPNPMVPFFYGRQVGQGVIDIVPPSAQRKRYVVLVPAVDADGNETGGLHMPEQAVPAQTSTGWSLRSDLASGAGELCYLDGNSIPFAPTQAAREAAKDPRASMVERYKDRDTYLTKVRENAQALAKDGYVLPEDIDRIVARADRNAKFENGAQ